jgi:Ser/Thr protein kinase RdoA (MazF antagonist)
MDAVSRRAVDIFATNHRVPRALLTAAVVAAGGATPAAIFRRVSGGYNNDVFLATAGNLRVVIRINRDGGRRFPAEAWALRSCAAAGVPVPMVLFVGDLDHGGIRYHVCVQRRLPGSPMSSTTLSPAQAADLASEAGRLLAAVHTVSPAGFGILDGDGRGMSDVPLAVDWSERLAQLVDVGTRRGIDEKLVERAVATLAGSRSAAGTPQLTHGDFAPKHVLVSRRRITGLIDFENCEGGNGMKDVAFWRYFTRPDPLAEEFFHGYEDGVPLSEAQRIDLRLASVELSMIYLHALGESPTCPVDLFPFIAKALTIDLTD